MLCAVACSNHPEARSALDEITGRIQEQFPEETSPDLLVLFATPHHEEVFSEIGDQLRTRLNASCLVGTSAESVLAENRAMERQPVLALWAAHLPDVRIEPIRIECLQQENEFSLRGVPAPTESTSDNPVSIVLFPDPFSTPAQELIRILETRFPNSTIVGGMASGGHAPGQNTLFVDGATYNSGVVGFSLAGEIEMRTVLSQGCRPIGRQWVITEAEGNAIVALGGQPALVRLQEIFDELDEDERELAQRALHIGMVMNEYQDSFAQGDFLIRNVLGVDANQGVLFVSDHVRTGQTVQFQIREPQSACDDLELRMNNERDSWTSPPAGGLIFTCNGRGSNFFETADQDLEAVRQATGSVPLAGFFAQGEIGPVGGQHYVHGFTASVALFSPPDKTS